MDTLMENESTSGQTDLVDEDQNDSSVLNSTTAAKATKRNYINVQKNFSVEDGVVSKLFTESRNYGKRTTLQKRLPNEHFDQPSDPVFKQNKTGFLTERPLEWMKAIEEYVENESDVHALRTYKADEGGIIHECEISTWFNTMTEVTLTISS